LLTIDPRLAAAAAPTKLVGPDFYFILAMGTEHVFWPSFFNQS